MTDSETPPEPSIEDRFRIVHDHLDLVDRTLAELADELETELEIVLEDTTFDVTYDLDTGSFHADLSIEHVVSRLNECLEPPLFARVEGETVQIGDVRRFYDIDPETLAVEQSQTVLIPETGNTDRIPLLKELIQQLQQADEQHTGAPESAVIDLLMYAGYTRSKVKEELRQLRDRGEIYMPKEGYLHLV